MAVLTPAQTRQAVERHFGDLGSVVVDFMTEVISQESGRDPTQVGDNFASGHQSSSSPARYDYGLAQINSQHGYDPKRLIEDIDYNLAAARTIYDRQGPGAWATAPTAVANLRARSGETNVASSEEARRIVADWRAQKRDIQTSDADLARLAAAVDGALRVGATADEIRIALDVSGGPQFSDIEGYITRVRQAATAGGQAETTAAGEVARLDDIEAALGLGSDSPGSTAEGATTGNAFVAMREAQIGAAQALMDGMADGSLFSGVDPAEVPLLMGEYSATLSGMLDNINMLNTLERDGGFLGSDGSFISLDDFDNADPLVQAQARAEFFKFGEDVFGSGNAYLRQLGLEEFIVDPADRETWVDPSEIRNRAQAKFENDLAGLQAKIDIENLSVDDAVKRIDRTLSGMQESRSRAEYVTDTLMDAAKWASPSGKTSFTASDLGAGVGALARQAGISGGSPLVNYTGIQNIDPAGTLARYDDSILGGQTLLDQIPQRTIDFSSIPQPPNLSEIPLVPFQATAGATPMTGYGQPVPNVVGAPSVAAPARNPQPTNEQRQILSSVPAGAPPIVARIGGLADSAEGPL